MRASTLLKIIYLFFLMLILGCRPELPVTSSITIEMEGISYPVNKELYGLTIEEINHAIDGGIYAELIQNRSFEDGVIPLNCAYDRGRNLLITPNGFSLPFISPDSIPGWEKLSANTYLTIDNKKAINDKNQRSLMVAAYASEATGRGGVIANGYNGIPIRKGEKYNLSFFTRTASSVVPRTIRIALEDSTQSNVLSDTYQMTPSFEWRKLQYTFTATEDAPNAVLTFSTDSSTFFWLDVVSLMPENTWKNRPNGLRPDLMEMIDALNPSFIRFPGGVFVEGYAAGTFPTWKESIGDISERKPFWNIWGYGSSNGMGFHEFLQMCEDLKSEPVYVVNSGISNQQRRPRYEDITQMEKLIDDVLSAIAYANQPADSTFGAMRAANGHREPFQLKYIEIGSENFGYEYARRFELFKKAIHTVYPNITVISSSQLRNQHKIDWTDQHYHGSEAFFISNHKRFTTNYERQSPTIFIGEFSTTSKNKQGTLRAAIAEACFLIGVEKNPDGVKRLAYAPALGNVTYGNQEYPLLSFNNTQVVASPSYYLLQMFNKFLGDNILNTEVNTFLKPQVIPGQACLEVFDNGYAIQDIKVNNKTASDTLFYPNRLNSIVVGDSLLYNYDFSATISRIKGNEPIRFFVRDNGYRNNEAEHICMTFGTSVSELYYQAGSIKDSLSSKTIEFENDKTYNLKISCKNDTIRCYVNNALLHEAILPPLPSLVSLAISDKENNSIILKVVNTTHHDEKTEIHIPGVRIKKQTEIIELSGLPDERNTFDNPTDVVPVEKSFSFPRNRNLIYNFPANSVTIIKLTVD